MHTSYYSRERILSDVAWLADGIEQATDDDLLKLAVPQILAKEIEQVIVLDNDMTFAADVAGLWTLFRSFSSRQVN